MSRKEDVVIHFMSLPDVTAIESEKLLTLLEQAVNFGFEQGERFGKYGAYVEKQNERIIKELIQPENDRVCRAKLEDIMKDSRECTSRLSLESKTVQLLGLITEILLVRKNGS